MTEFNSDKLTEAEMELIGSFLDGELHGEMADKVARRIEHDPIWSAQAQKLRKLDEVLGAWTVDAPASDFSRKLHKRIHRSKPSTYLRWAAPLATAACIAFASWLSIWSSNAPQPTANAAGTFAQIIETLPESDRFVVENLDWLEDYQLLADFETIEEIQRIDSTAYGYSSSNRAIASIK